MKNLYLLGILNIFICAILGFIIGPLINKIGYKLQIVDIPNSRKINKSPLVRFGGFTIASTFFCYSFLISKFLNFSSILFNEYKNFSILFCGALAYFLLGLHDDKYRSSPFMRLSVQSFIALGIAISGINIASININIPFIGYYSKELPVIVAYFLTCFWIVGLTNAINWLDGFDGLAAGFCSIISFGLFIHFMTIGKYEGAILFSILSGSTIGFLARNFKPSQYIMGDCGSYFLGFCLSIGIINYSSNNIDNSLSIIYVFILFSVPIFDMAYVVLKRLINNSSLFIADSNHLHHRLLKANLSYREIIFSVFTYTVLCVFLSYIFL